MKPFGPEIWQTAIDAWPPALCRLALPFERIDAARGDFIRIGAAMPGFEAHIDESVPRAFSDMFLHNLCAAFENRPNGIHLRFPLCSLKKRQRAPRILSPEAALDSIAQPNARVSGMILQALRQDRATALYAFPWQAIEPWSEFRLFIRNRELVGVSQYHLDRPLPEIQQHAGALRPVLRDIGQHIIAALHIPSAVADVFVLRTADGALKATLIEINPFLTYSAACLFSMEEGGDFDGTFRFLQGCGPDPVEAVPIA